MGGKWCVSAADFAVKVNDFRVAGWENGLLHTLARLSVSMLKMARVLCPTYVDLKSLAEDGDRARSG